VIVKIWKSLFRWTNGRWPLELVGRTEPELKLTVLTIRDYLATDISLVGGDTMRRQGQRKPKIWRGDREMRARKIMQEGDRLPRGPCVAT
jgi:hypothetical protein